MAKSLLRYPGGKTRACKFLYEIFPKDVKKVCSPFFGGGSFEFYLNERGFEIIGYDAFYDLFCFWEKAINEKEKLLEEVMNLYPMNKELFYKLQKEDEKDDLKKAAKFYALNRSSFSGSTLSGGMSPNSPRFNENSINRLKEFKVEKLKVEFMDFEKSIELNKENFLFLDPPYYIKGNIYGNKGDMHKNFDHLKLSELLLSRKDWILCYNDCEFIRNLYAGCEFIDISWSYGMNKTKKSNEIIIKPL